MEIRPVALRGHVANASFKRFVGILLMPKIDRAHKNYLTPEIWEGTHLRVTFYGTLIFQQSIMAWFVLAAMLEGILLHERGEREGSACYKSRCFCNPPTIFSTNPMMSLSIRDQSQVRDFSAWSELITLFTGNCQVETLFSIDIIIERNETFLLFLLQQQTRQT